MATRERPRLFEQATQHAATMTNKVPSPSRLPARVYARSAHARVSHTVFSSLRGPAVRGSGVPKRFATWAGESRARVPRAPARSSSLSRRARARGASRVLHEPVRPPFDMGAQDQSRPEGASELGLLIGHVHEDRCVPLLHVRRGSSIPPGLVPGGLDVVGVHLSYSDASVTPEQLAALLEPQASNLRKMLAKAPPSPLLAVDITEAGLEVERRYFSLQLQPKVSLALAEVPPRAELLDSFHANYIGLRARFCMPVQVFSGAEGQWGAESLREALQRTRGELRSPTTRFIIDAAPHLGALTPGADSTARCAAIADGEGGPADAEEGGEASRGAGGKSGKGGRRGGKKGGKARRAAPGAHAGAAASDGESAADATGLYATQIVWARCRAPEATRRGFAAPVLTLSRATEMLVFEREMQLDVVIFAPNSEPIGDAMKRLQDGLVAQFDALCDKWTTAPRGTLEQMVPTACAFHPAQIDLPIMAQYLLRDGEPSEAAERSHRETLHDRLGLPTDRPLLRSDLYLGASSAHGGIHGLLRNAHVGLPPSGVKGGKLSLVQGSYEYYHYMQPTGHGQLPAKYDDNGWGCAYRSLMSIISWYRLQNYSSFPNPTHYEIQKRLVDDCGQDADILGKKRWIGSHDVQMFLDDALDVTSKIHSCSSGDELATLGRFLSQHFETQVRRRRHSAAVACRRGGCAPRFCAAVRICNLCL